jgi:hypothetical protein
MCVFGPHPIRRRIYACYMRRRIHACHMKRRIHACVSFGPHPIRRRIHACHMRRKINACVSFGPHPIIIVKIMMNFMMNLLHLSLSLYLYI